MKRNFIVIVIAVLSILFVLKKSVDDANERESVNAALNNEFKTVVVSGPAPNTYISDFSDFVADDLDTVDAQFRNAVVAQLNHMKRDIAVCSRGMGAIFQEQNAGNKENPMISVVCGNASDKKEKLVTYTFGWLDAVNNTAPHIQENEAMRLCRESVELKFRSIHDIKLSDTAFSANSDGSATIISKVKATNTIGVEQTANVRCSFKDNVLISSKIF